MTNKQIFLIFPLIIFLFFFCFDWKTESFRKKKRQWPFHGSLVINSFEKDISRKAQKKKKKPPTLSTVLVVIWTFFFRCYIVQPQLIDSGRWFCGLFWCLLGSPLAPCKLLFLKGGLVHVISLYFLFSFFSLHIFLYPPNRVRKSGFKFQINDKYTPKKFTFTHSQGKKTYMY